VATQEIAEAEEEADLFVEAQAHYILAANLIKGRRLTVAREYLEFFEVNVNGMLPAAGVILQDPYLRSPLLYAEAGFVTVDELSINLPLTVPSFEAERSSYSRLIDGRGRQVVELGNSRRVLAVVGHRRKHNVESEYLITLARGQYIICRAAPVDLLKAILQKDRGPRRTLREVYYHVFAFGDAEARAGDLDRFGQKVAVV